MVEIRDQHQVLLAGEQVVYRRELAGDTDRGAHRVGFAGKIEAGDVDLPGVRLRSVDRIWTVVVFPAPLGPSSEKVVPSAISRSIPSRTVLSPKDLRSPVTFNADGDVVVVMPRPYRVVRGKEHGGS